MEEVIENYFETFSSEKFIPGKIKIFTGNYKKFFPSDLNTKVLDIGIGLGEMLTCMKNWGYDYIGIDISPSIVNYCQSKELNCELVNNTIEWLQKHKGEFKLITLLDVLEHIDKKEIIQLLKAINEALQYDGTLIVQVPNMQAPDNQMMLYGDITHVTAYTEESLNQVLVNSGFKKITFCGLENLHSGEFLKYLRRFSRYLYFELVKFIRTATGNGRYKVLNFVIFAVARKS